jgi:hypothetical protein
MTFEDGAAAKNIRIPRRGERGWNSVLKCLGLPWSRLECLDKDGSLMDIIEPSDDALPADGSKLELQPTPGASRSAELSAHLELMLRAQDVAMMRQERSLSLLLNGYDKLVTTVSERLSALEKVHGQVLELAHKAAHKIAASELDQGGESDGPLDRLAAAVIAQSGLLGPPGDGGKGDPQ